MNRFVMVLLSAVFALISVSAVPVQATADDDLCAAKSLGAQPILAEGRVVPLSVYAAKVRKNLFPPKTCAEVSAESLYCMLSQGRRAEVEQKYGCKILLKAEHAETQKLLNVSERMVAPDVALRARDNIAQTYHMLQQNGKGESGFGSDLSNLLMHIDRLTAIESGTDWKIIDTSKNWVSLRDYGPGAVVGLVLNQTERLTPAEARTLKLETIYEGYKPFTIAVVFCLIGFLLSVLSIDFPKFEPWTKAMIFVVLALQVAGMALRVMISGRAPVTNMYETVMWVGFGVFSLSAILGWRMNDKKVLAIGFGGNSIALFMMSFANKMLDSTIQPLVPVLRDNFWLSTHVTTITLSYACFALAWIVSNFVLVRWLLGNRKLELVQRWNNVIRLSIQIGSVLLAAGIILGGIWADYSWGRFWGWDPKETWSLIALVVYAGILHGRYVGWFKDLVFSAMGAVGFMFVLMAWFGVNYILAVGLHSYGFSSGGSLFLATIFIAQITVLSVVFFVGPNAVKKTKTA